MEAATSATALVQPGSGLDSVVARNEPFTPEQRAVLEDRRRFRAVIADRRWGKTRLACIELLRSANEKVGDYLYLAPSLDMAIDIGWETMLSVAPAGLITKAVKFTRSHTLANGSVIHFASAQKGKVPKVANFSGAALDEFAMYRHDIWASVVFPSIDQLRGWALFLTTSIKGELGPCWDSIKPLVDTLSE